MVNKIRNIIAIIKRKRLKIPIIYNYHKYCNNIIGHVLLYYKIDPFLDKSLADSYRHPGNWWILEIVKMLNQLGFYVDIVDRTVDIKKFRPEDKYDIFIGIGSKLAL